MSLLHGPDKNDLFQSAAAPADAVANAGKASFLQTLLSGYNGTSWDRLRTGVTALGTSVTGYLNILPTAVYNASPTTRTEGQYGSFQADALGNLKVTLGTNIAGEDTTNNLMGVSNVLVSAGTYSPTVYTNFAANAAASVKASAGVVAAIYAFNSTGTTHYFQLHNKASAPVANDVPAFPSIYVPANTGVIVGADFFTATGMYFGTGIAYGDSTVPEKYTASSATYLYTTVLYL